MAVSLYIQRSRNQPAIELNEWLSIIEADTNLRHRTSPYAAVNPVTRATIEIAVGDADSEICIDDEWAPFLMFRRGRLTMNYITEFADPSNLQRQKIAAIASKFNALIVTDVDDDPLAW